MSNKAVFVIALSVLAFIAPKQAAAQNYLPLAPGNTWQLSIANVQASLTVKSYSVVNGTPRATIQFSNPWFTYSMLVRSTSAGILLEGVQFPSGVNGYPDPVMLFGIGAIGQTWSSAYVSSKIVSMNNTVVTPLGTYRNVTRFDVTLGGSLQTWYMAPAVGFVQFGEGTGLQLSAVTLNQAPSPSIPASARCPEVGITANPKANGDFSDAGKDAAFHDAANSGSNFATIAASWGQMEPSPGVYDFSSVAHPLSLSAKYGVDAVFTVKTIDTSFRSVPADLASFAWDDPRMISRWTKFVAALLKNLNSRVKYLNFGNEVDTYLTSYPSEIAPFSAFLQAGQSVVASASPSIVTGVVFAFDSWRVSDFAFRALYPLVNEVSFTYYDANSQLAGTLQRAVADVPFDFADMLTAANGKPLVLTEVGYTSSAGVGSSPLQQQAFYSTALTQFAAAGGGLAGATFAFMSDFPASIISALTVQYGSSSPWLFWISGLGLFDEQGNAKPAWTAFSSQAAALKSNLGCTH